MGLEDHYEPLIVADDYVSADSWMYIDARYGGVIWC